MPSPPSIVSSASSSSEAVATQQLPAATTGATRDPPLDPPRPLFFIDRRSESNTIEEERRTDRNDPFRTPDLSSPPTPSSQRDNPFSPPGSILNGIDGGLHSRVQSRVSVASSVNSSGAPIGRPGLGSRTSTMRDSFMSPAPMQRRTATAIPSASRFSLAAPRSKRLKSTMLTGTIEKPWTTEKDTQGRLAYWITYLVAFLGVAGSALRCYFAWKDVPRVGNLCLVMEDDFNTFDTENTWFQEVDMGGFGCVSALIC